MKFINIAISLLFVASTDAASINKQFDEQVSHSYLRKSSARNVPGSPEDWLQAINDARVQGQMTITEETTYDEDGNMASSVSASILEWSADLANQAQGWANTLASECKIAIPDGVDYGINAIANVRNPATAVERWMTNGYNAAKIPSNKSDAMTQILWDGTRYVGCADAESSKSGKSCTASVCYFGKAGNCAWGKYNTWQEAVMSGKVCSKTCPSDGNCD